MCCRAFLQKTTRADDNRAGHSSKMRGETDFSNIYSKMSDSIVKCRKSM